MGFLTGAHRVSITRAMKALRSDDNAYSNFRNFRQPH
ncbi:MAG: hypothetical protein WAL90_12765 [Desulfobacterales bacterium]